MPVQANLLKKDFYYEICNSFKLEYLLENFESINSFTVVTKINREFDSNYLVIIHMNSKYFTKEELNNSLADYFKNLPIEYSIIVDEG